MRPHLSLQSDTIMMVLEWRVFPPISLCEVDRGFHWRLKRERKATSVGLGFIGSEEDVTKTCCSSYMSLRFLKVTRRKAAFAGLRILNIISHLIFRRTSISA